MFVCLFPGHTTELVGSEFPTREGTHAPCRGGTEAQSQDHQGIPRAMSILNIPFMPSISSHIKDTADNRKPFVEGQEE